MSNPRCDACKHWDKTEHPRDGDRFRQDMGRCHAVPHVSDQHDKEFKHTMAVVEDGCTDDYTAWLYTQPIFFCAMFKAKADDTH